MRISARTADGKSNVILVDEPGLFLHASAQRDIYKRLLSISANENIQIIFTTHSPYLLRPDELHRIRLIDKKSIKKGTKVSNKIHANADKETLTPILTTIGLELNQGIHNVHQYNNVVVEGPSDKFYLDAFSKFFNEDRLNFIFGGGSSNMGNVGTILEGWECNVIYLYDNDQGKVNGAKKLIKTWFVKKELIQTVINDQGSIEDLFSKEDFVKYVLGESIESVNIETTNSDYLKKQKIDKVLLSRKFLSIILKGKIDLSEETINSFKSVYNKLRKSFELTND